MDNSLAKPMAANGGCRRRATGVMTNLAEMEATSTAIAALEWNRVSAGHLSAWAITPTATGQASMRRGMEK